MIKKLKVTKNERNWRLAYWWTGFIILNFIFAQGSVSSGWTLVIAFFYGFFTSMAGYFCLPFFYEVQEKDLSDDRT